MKRGRIQALASKMDNLGILAFLFVIIYASIELAKEQKIMTWILLIVGILGFLVDSFIVIEERLNS